MRIMPVQEPTVHRSAFNCGTDANAINGVIRRRRTGEPRQVQDRWIKIIQRRANSRDRAWVNIRVCAIADQQRLANSALIQAAFSLTKGQVASWAALGGIFAAIIRREDEDRVVENRIR